MFRRLHTNRVKIIGRAPSLRAALARAGPEPAEGGPEPAEGSRFRYSPPCPHSMSGSNMPLNRSRNLGLFRHEQYPEKWKGLEQPKKYVAADHRSVLTRMSAQL